MEWKYFEISDKKIIDEFTLNKFNVADYNFTNQFIWSIGEKAKFKIEKDVLIIKAQYEDMEYYYMPIPKNMDNLDNFYEIIEKIINMNGKIRLIPEEYKEILEKKYNLVENRDTFDYIYNTEDLAYLKGRKFTKKKNKINKFIKTYKYEYQEITQKNIKDIIKFQEKWYNENQDKENIITVLYNENEGIMRMLENYENLNLLGGLIKVNGEIIAYSIGEILNEDFALVHIEKALDSYRGSYQMINKLFAKEECLDKNHKKYINREDDFGKLGLREAKLSYNPCMMLRKYEIESKK